ncbi:MAG: hypothetical protein AAF903_10140 [Pseudomonadota bacterium]
MRGAYILILIVGSTILGLICGSILTAYAFSATVATQGMNSVFNFNEFVGVLLACIAIIMTLFGVFAAILAVYGFASIESKAGTIASNAVNSSLEEGGKLATSCSEQVEVLVAKLSSPGGKLHTLTVETVQKTAAEAIYGEIQYDPNEGGDE